MGYNPRFQHKYWLDTGKTSQDIGAKSHLLGAREELNVRTQIEFENFDQLLQFACGRIVPP